MNAASRQGQTNRGDAGAESNRGAEGDDGKVIIFGVYVVVGMSYKGQRQYSANIEKTCPSREKVYDVRERKHTLLGCPISRQGVCHSS
jgi:hypothetical protein